MIPKRKHFNFTMIFIAVLLHVKSFAQTDLSKRIPPSPQTQALINLPEFNMGLADGLPTISIPIYEVKAGKLSLPISISYNPQGRKVTDLSGPVGIGWSLNCGGLISRTVYGKPDEESAFPSVMPDAQTITNSANYDFIQGSYYDIPGLPYRYDTEYDVYSYQCGNKSGKFVYSRAGGGKAYLVPRYNIKINNLPAFPNEIVDDNGDSYQYNYNETVQYYKNPQSIGGTITSAGYLTKMKSPYGDEINLSYTYLSKEVYTKDQERILYDNPLGASSSVPTSSFTTQNVPAALHLVRVTEINFKHGKVTFEMFNSNDQVKFIRVYDILNHLIKSFEFVYSALDNSDYVYSVSSNPNLPWIHTNLKLDAIKISDENGIETQRYGFEYNSSETFTVQSRDDWGFRNGSTQTNVLPDYYTSYNNGTLNVGTGANRNPNAFYAMKGTLKKIIYPTGGATEFVYEGNRVLNANNNPTEGPGLRIKEIRQLVNGTVVSSKNYEYPPTGELPLYPTSNYVHRSTETREYPQYKVPNGSAIPDLSMGTNYRKRTFSSEMSPGVQNYMQQPVFYNLITEYRSGEVGLGKTVYSYEKSYQSYPGQFYFPSLSSAYPANIFPGFYDAAQQDYYARNYYIPNADINPVARLGGISHYKYNASAPTQYELVSSTTNIYTLRQAEVLVGMRFSKYLNFLLDGGSNIYYEKTAMSQDNMPVYQFVNYNVPTSYYEITRKISTAGGISEISDIEYNSNNVEKTITTTDSRGDVVKTEMSYPYDYPGDAAMQGLVAKNRVYESVESKTTNITANKVVAGEKLDYANWGNDIYEPVTVKKFSSVSGLESVTDFKKYDSFGRVLSTAKSKGPDVIYVYSYGGDFPIAEIKNADYSTVESLLGGSIAVEDFSKSSNPTRANVVNFLAPLRSNLPDAQIITFTYEPLVGMTSQTDPRGMTTYYEYDSFHRLKTIKNQNGFILKTYCYNYAGQVTDCNSSTGTTPSGPSQIYARIEELNKTWGPPIDGSTTEVDVYIALYSDAACTQPVSLPQGIDVNVSTTGTYFENNSSSVSTWTNTYTIPANSERLFLGRLVTDSWYSYYDPYYGQVINSYNYLYQVENNGTNTYIPSPTN